MDKKTFHFTFDKNEKLYKFWFFRPEAGKEINFEYRIMTKEKANGLLDLVSYNFKIISGIPQKNSITQATNITKNKINNIIHDVMISTKISSDELEELDLSGFNDINEQIYFLSARDIITKDFLL